MYIFSILKNVVITSSTKEIVDLQKILLQIVVQDLKKIIFITGQLKFMVQRVLRIMVVYSILIYSSHLTILLNLQN